MSLPGTTPRSTPVPAPGAAAGTSRRQQILEETAVTRQRAHALLRSLLEHKRQSENRFREMGAGMGSSPAGRRAIDDAIGSTRAMIAALDRTLEQTQDDLCDEDLDLLDER